MSNKMKHTMAISLLIIGLLMVTAGSGILIPALGGMCFYTTGALVQSTIGKKGK